MIESTPLPKWLPIWFVKGLSIFIGIIGVFTIIISIGASIYSYQTSDWPHTQGEVTSYRKKLSVRQNDRYNFTVQFTVDGKVYETGDAVSKKMPSIGESYEVAYNPNNPNDARVEYGTSPTVVYLGFFVLLIIGVVATLVSIPMYKLAKKGRQLGRD